MTNSQQGSKFNINIGKISGGEIQVGDRTYYGHQISPKSENAAPTSSPDPKRTILVVAASPVNQAKLRLDREVREIDEGLRLAKHREKFDLQQRWAVRPNDLRRALLEIQPQIVHFCGHGEGEAGLLLEDELGKAKLVSTEAIAGLFQLFAERGLECVVLNACYSKVQAEAIAQHINYVVGMSDAIADKAAISFAVGFYDALGAGWSYTDAYSLGCNAIALEGIAQNLLPVLKQKT
ncbi:MAG: CHAT domain-containing protein [Drouetiella hepatica Uher 2000/2452]|jgi:hypothetical protein|uniref:CHAT domain-containing protein n=1 Tax=Drouetiella hepatica Uher 2000/2452 TaxID=904376 RepID=A0A951UQL6_9CYAN|nr:CHAT domain-containing protein [Drouetiella hepatica Uher 2000/2452]